MRDIAISDRVTGGLSQLKKTIYKAPFLFKGRFSGFITKRSERNESKFSFPNAVSVKSGRLSVILVSASFLSVFPGLPPILPDQILSAENLSNTEEVKGAVVDKKKEELCLWQKDVSFFDSLDDKKKRILQKEVPCLEKEQAPMKVTKGKDSDQDLHAAIEAMAAGYPLEAMAGTISEYDRDVAGLIVGIAKKESNWGKRVPRTADGADCFNYWGYKGAGTKGVAMGHGCFATPEEAVHAVGNRLSQLVELRKTSEPKNMVIWKCGSSCATHDPESVRKWVSDVDIYYKKIAGK